MIVIVVMGFNGFIVLVVGIVVLLFLNVVYYVVLGKDEIEEEIFIYIVIDFVGV